MWPVYDQPAADFAIEFYRQVLRGEMIGQALLQARKKVKAEHPASITWASFILYGDPIFRLLG
jgi:CHAT domain-containing protein